ncbi:MAG: UTP--glucose-1-phosphate uridylyltransferase [Chitinispirillales bacterium]|jgi:UTP--glucose-1-phosphate uridylyltransferase|nr:UTP--glucose-1-phosphate uridylyltransferase [Chitinispirillales bacterium]
MSDVNIKLFTEKMLLENQPQAVIDVFLRYYGYLRHGKNGCIAEGEILPISAGEIGEYSQIKERHADRQNALAKTVIIKLNGGLGTSMGLYAPKSLIPVKNGLSFLDITALQIRDLNERLGVSIPLILMNSFSTERDSLDALAKYQDIKTEIPFSFIQNKFPRINVSGLAPVSNPENPKLEWNPPGHGDLYTAILSSGLLDMLLDKGYRYAFISNIDNLGAVLDTRILGYFANKGIPFLMEVTDRTFMDRKGGHLARLKNGKLILREAAQCPKECMDSFMDTGLHRYFNTNNLWVRLDALKGMWDAGTLELPMICNAKRLDARDCRSPEVMQLESAMGSAISVFENADALRVPRSRFAPVKSCEDLLLLWSDYYDLTGDYRVVMNPAHKSIQMDVTLDRRFYRTLDHLKERFPNGAPSLTGCESLTVDGDVRFGENIVITGKTSITNIRETQAFIPDGAQLSGDVTAL